jgi:hypothetical protein
MTVMVATLKGIESAFGSNLERLAAIKTKYDLDNFFRLNNNITPG